MENFVAESTRETTIRKTKTKMAITGEVRKCLLSFGAESFVFQVAIQKFKNQDI